MNQFLNNSHPAAGVPLTLASKRWIPLRIMAPDGREAYVELVDGVLVLRGNLPVEETAQAFLKAIAGSIHGSD